MNYFSAEVGYKFCPIVNKPIENCQRLLQFSQRVEISVNLVTLAQWKYQTSVRNRATTKALRENNKNVEILRDFMRCSSGADSIKWSWSVNC